MGGAVGLAAGQGEVEPERREDHGARAVPNAAATVPSATSAAVPKILKFMPHSFPREIIS